MKKTGEQMSYPVVLHLAIRTPAEGRQKLLDFLREVVPFYEQPGGIRIRLFQSLDDPNSFTEVVEYVDRATYDRDNIRVRSDREMKSSLDRWRSLLEGSVETAVYQDLSSEIHGGPK